MGDGPRGRTAVPDWPLAYLIVSAVGVGVVVGVRHWFPEPLERYELVPIGFVVCAYAITSAWHYYEVTRKNSLSGVPTIDER